jgi:hypothetical protein
MNKQEQAIADLLLEDIKNAKTRGDITTNADQRERLTCVRAYREFISAVSERVNLERRANRSNQ